MLQPGFVRCALSTSHDYINHWANIPPFAEFYGNRLSMCAIRLTNRHIHILLGEGKKKLTDSTGVSCTQPAADIRVCRPSQSSLCRHDYAAGAADSSCNSWRPRLSGGSGAGVEQSVSTDQGRLVAVVFSAADKGPSVSAVVQLTSDYCTIVFFLNLICKVPCNFSEASL